MDPLSDVLSLLKPRTFMSGGFDMGGAWSVRFPQHDGIKCYALISGQCWLSVDGLADALRLTSGDCFLLPHGRPFTLTNDLALTPADAYAMFPLAPHGVLRVIGGGGDCSGVGGYFSLIGNHSDLLLNVLPPVVHIQRESDKTAMRWCLERMMLELREPRPGGFLLGQQLASMMLVQALRLHLEDGLNRGVGWPFALADKQLSAAMSAMHEAPGQPWTLHQLAIRAGMSRSAFAKKFKEIVGTSPMEYLTRWRMLLAGDRLVNTGDAISAIAPTFGYESENAFSTAFRRVMGCSPRQYSKGNHPTPAAFAFKTRSPGGGQVRARRLPSPIASAAALSFKPHE